MTYIIEFKNGRWLRVTEEQGEKIIKVLEEPPLFIKIDGNSYATNTITSITKDR